MSLHTSGHPPGSPPQHADATSHNWPVPRGVLLHWLMFAILLLTVPAFYLQLDAVEPVWRRAGSLLYAFVSLSFLLDLVYRLRGRRGRDRDRDRAWNIWLDAAIIVGTATSALSPDSWSHVAWALRSVLLIVIVLRMMVFLHRLFSPQHIVYLLGLGAGMLALAGAGFYWLEPTVHSYADGLWLAFESGATVGYGDLLPTTPSSRLFAAFMVLLGYALMSLVTGAIAAAFVGEDEKRLRRELHADIKALRNEVEALRSALDARATDTGQQRATHRSSPEEGCPEGRGGGSSEEGCRRCAVVCEARLVAGSVLDPNLRPPCQGTSTAAPSILPSRNRSSAWLASASGNGMVIVRTGILGAIPRNSSPSWRVRLATERTERSSQRIR